VKRTTERQTVRVPPSQATAGRRELLGLATVLAASATVKPALAGPACEDFTTGEGGIQFCDYTVGEGNSPVKGALIR
jgi:hypothetical protein